MGCKSSKSRAGLPDVVEEEIPVQAENDNRLYFEAKIINPIMHNVPAFTRGIYLCQLIINKRRKLLTRKVGCDEVTINIGSIAAVDRDISNSLALTIVSGMMQEPWRLVFRDTEQRYAFYQELLVYNPFGVEGGIKSMATHFFCGHFRAMLAPDASQLAGIVPQNPDGYIFAVSGATQAQREVWFKALLKSTSAEMGGKDPWLQASVDDEQDGGTSIFAWIDPKHRRCVGNLRASELWDESRGHVSMLEFTLGETSFGFFNVKGEPGTDDIPVLLDALNPCHNSLGVFQYDHIIMCGDITAVDVGNDDIPLSSAHNIGKKQGFAWRSLARLPKAGCEQKAKGTIEAGSHGIFKMPIVIPIVTEPEEEDRPFILQFSGLSAEGLPPLDGVGEEKAQPYVVISGDVCKSAQCEATVGSLSSEFKKKQIHISQKGEVIDDIVSIIPVYTYVTDLDYLRMQRVSIQVRDYTHHSLYGHTLFSLASLCDSPFSVAQSFNVALNHNGRKGGRLSGKVSLHRLGDPTPSPELSLDVPKRAGGKLGAFEKIKSLQMTVTGGGDSHRSQIEGLGMPESIDSLGMPETIDEEKS